MPNTSVLTKEEIKRIEALKMLRDRVKENYEAEMHRPYQPGTIDFLLDVIDKLSGERGV